jgi:hypothetical protein
MPTQYPSVPDHFPPASRLTDADVLNRLNQLSAAIMAMQARMGSNLDAITGRLIHKTVTLTSAAAATAIPIFTAAEVEAGKKFYPLGFVAKVDGGTLWATTATVKIQETGADPAALATIAVAALTANAILLPGTADVTLGDAWSEGSGAAAGRGIEVVGDANGTGSDLKLTVWGIVK